MRNSGRSNQRPAANTKSRLIAAMPMAPKMCVASTALPLKADTRASSSGKLKS